MATVTLAGYDFIAGQTASQITSNQYGVGIGAVAPSNADDFVHIERTTPGGSTGILIYNRSETALADAFLHLYGGNPGVTGSDLRITTQAGAAGGEVNLTARCYSLATNTAAAFNIMNAGNAPITFYTNNLKSVMILPTASTVNQLAFRGSATGSSVAVLAQGTDTDISLAYYAKGAGGHGFRTNALGSLQFLVDNVASAVNYVFAKGSPTTSAVIVGAGGSDTNISIAHDAKGGGGHLFRTNGGAQTQFFVDHVASAVNYLSAKGAPTLSSVVLSAIGSDTNISIAIDAKGAGGVAVRTAGGATTQFFVDHVASATRYIKVAGSNGGNPTFTATAGLIAFASGVVTLASATGTAGLNLPHGAAPTAPVNGDVWTTTAGLFVRINGATVGPLT